MANYSMKAEPSSYEVTGHDVALFLGQKLSEENLLKIVQEHTFIDEDSFGSADVGETLEQQLGQPGYWAKVKNELHILLCTNGHLEK